MRIGKNTFEAFLEQTKGKRVVAFAASDFLQLISQNYPELMLGEKIDYIIDNDVSKHGKTICINNKIKMIYSIEKLKAEICQDIIILISSDVFVYEIYKQLEEIEELKNIECFALSLLVAKHSDYMNEGVKTGDKISIPKKIHCFWFSNDEKTDLAQKCIESWKKYCPDYEIIEWNAGNYDVRKNKYMSKAYDEKNWAYVSDYARLDVLYMHGGVYLDLDVELLKSMDVLLHHDFFIGFGPIRDIEAAAFGARPGCELLLEMMDIYTKKEFDPVAGTNLLNVQPVYLDYFFDSKGFNINGEYQENKGIAIYPREIFSPKNWFTGENEIKDCSIGIHHCVGGWTSEKSKKRKMIKYAGNKLMEQIVI